MDKLSYALGLGIGQQLAQMGAQDISAEDFAQAIKDVLGGKELKVSHREAQVIVQEYFQKQEQKLQAERAEKGKAAVVAEHIEGALDREEEDPSLHYHGKPRNI